MREFWRRYVQRPFGRAGREVAWFGPVVSAVLVALAVNLLTETLTAQVGMWMSWVVIGVLGLVIVAFVYGYSAREARRRAHVSPPIDLPGPPKEHGLVFLFSREETLREAIRYHQPALEHVWLLVTPQRQADAASAMTRFDASFTVHHLPDLWDSQACYRIVAQIYQHEVPRLGLEPQRVIADITGGTKPMTLGMIVACLEGGYPIEHVPTAYDATGAQTGPLPPIQIVVRCSLRGGT